jgi:hypothetical protein
LKAGMLLDDVARRHNMSPESIRRVLERAEVEERRNLKRTGLVLGGIILIALFGSIGSRDKSPTAVGDAGPTSAATTPDIPYIEVQDWDINGRGTGRVIVIDSQYRTDAALRQLGDQLRNAYSDDRMANIEVFDDSALAARRDRGIIGKLAPSLQQRFDRHYLGVYVRNQATGHESWVFGLNGVTQNPIEIKY